MLLALFGMYATGKTTFLERIMDRLPDLAPAGLTVVFCDLAMRYEFDREQDGWLQYQESERWRGKQERKIQDLENIVQDRTQLWVLESARYFSGMQEPITKGFLAAGGGAHFVVPYCNVATARKFLIARANKKGKTFRADYWDDKRLAYEASSRYLNVMTKHFIPLGIAVDAVEIDAARKNWATVEKAMLAAVSQPLEAWYGKIQTKNSANQGIQRQRQDNHRQAVVRAERQPKRDNAAARALSFSDGDG